MRKTSLLKSHYFKSFWKDNLALLQVVLYCKIALRQNDVVNFYLRFVASNMLFKYYGA